MGEAVTAVPTLWTIGHSTRSDVELLDMLKARSIERVVDVRSMPGSRRYPIFNSEAMARWLPDNAIAYQHMPQLGGRRRGQDVDPALNAGWRNASFRNFADYASTSPDFLAGILTLVNLARHERVAFMCAEAVPWRCHRSLIASALTIENVTVHHIMSVNLTHTHVPGQWGPQPVSCHHSVSYPMNRSIE